MSEPLLQINNICVAYHDHNEGEVVSDINITMNAGEILCIVGESGSGKSTLVKAIHGVGRAKVSAGEIIFEGRNMATLTPAERRRLMGPGIGLIPQNPYASFNPIRKYNVQIKEALAAHDMPYEEEKILQVFEKIGLEEGKRILSSRPYELSGGMNQRIAVAIAMIFEPRLLMCDEPTSALDVTTEGMVVEELLKLRQEQNTAILMVTHNLGIAAHMADKIAIMKDGHMIEYGSAETIFKSPGEEYTRELMEDVPRLRR